MKYFYFLLFGLLLGSCINPSDIAEAVKTKTPEFKIKNGIIIKEHGLKVQQAFLVYDDSTAVSDSNETNIDQTINCRVLITDGWKLKEGKVYPGVSNIIETSTGDTLANEPDLLKDYDSTGIAPHEIDHINISATISKLEKQYDYFLVRFKVWDKNGDAYTEGSFKFKLR